MVKKAVTLYLEEDLIASMKERNYNISFLCNEALRVYTDENFNDVEVAAKLSAIDAVILDLMVAAEKKNLEYQASLGKVEAMKKRREIIKQEYLEAQKTLRVSRMIRELNSNIIASDFNTDTVSVSCKQLIRNIEEMSEYFNLETHVKRLRNVLL